MKFLQDLGLASQGCFSKFQKDHMNRFKNAPKKVPKIDLEVLGL